jgi:hypothetical protein
MKKAVAPCSWNHSTFKRTRWADFDEVPSIFSVIREFGRTDPIATTSQHSHLVAAFLALSRLSLAVRMGLSSTFDP